MRMVLGSHGSAAAGQRPSRLICRAAAADKTARADLTLDHFVRATEDIVGSQNEPFVLVGHSASGTVLSEIAQRMPERAARLAYVAAMLLPGCESIFSGFVARTPPDPAIAVQSASAQKADDAGLRRRAFALRAGD